MVLAVAEAAVMDAARRVVQDDLVVEIVVEELAGDVAVIEVAVQVALGRVVVDRLGVGTAVS